MKIFFGFLLITVVAGNQFKTIQDEFIFEATRVEECGANEEYHSCGSTCFPTCFIHYYPQICLRMCIPGCYCKMGFVQASNGSCIRFKDCPRETENTSLIRNCFDVPKKGSCITDIAMWYYDRESGFCRRFHYGGCGGNGNRYASEEECLQQCQGERFRRHECGENSHFNGCGIPNPITCENYENPPEYRVMMCKTGCQCNEGYVQNEDGSCVLPENCPRIVQECGENSRYNGCGTPCPITCENYENPPEYCTMMCNPGCHCEEGYVRKEDGSCVLPENCPKKVDVKSCVDPPEVGPCREIIPRWFYKQETGTCHQFLFGGCQGNGNNYSTEEECLQYCGADES